MRMAFIEPENGYTGKSGADVNAARWINWCRKTDKSLITALEASIVTDNDNVYEEVGYGKIRARWAPRILTGMHKSQRFQIATSYLQRFREERSEPLQSMGQIMKRWGTISPLLTKQAVMLQKHPTSPGSRTFKVCPQAGKVMAYILWAAEVKPQGTSIDANASYNSLQRLQEDTRGSQPSRLSPGVIFSARQPSQHTTTVVFLPLGTAELSTLEPWPCLDRSTNAWQVADSTIMKSGKAIREWLWMQVPCFFLYRNLNLAASWDK